MKYINMFDNNTFKILAVIVIVFILYVVFAPRRRELFSTAEQELDSYYDGATKGIEEYLVDNMTCSPLCCGDQWPVPFDDLTPNEIEKCIKTDTGRGPYVRTNMTCGNGIGGVGCPCINKKAYKYLVNRGENTPNIRGVEPTLLIKNDESQRIPRDNVPRCASGRNQLNVSAANETQYNKYQTDTIDDFNWSKMTPLEQLQSRKSMFVDTPKMNDTYLERPLVNINNVQGSKATN